MRQRRKSTRHPVHWRIVIVAKKAGKNEILHGCTYNLAEGGAAIYSDSNIFVAGSVAMTIEVPVLNHKNKSTVVGVQCRLLYTVLSSNYGKFRSVVKFMRFKDDGRRVLTEALSQRVASSGVAVGNHI